MKQKGYLNIRIKRQNDLKTLIKEHKSNKNKAPDLLSITVMKVYLGCDKWKDYVNLYFILNSRITLNEIIQRSTILFNNGNNIMFNHRNFLEQLTYYYDVSYEEVVFYKINPPPTNNEIKSFLNQQNIKYLKNTAFN